MRRKTAGHPQQHLPSSLQDGATQGNSGVQHSLVSGAWCDVSPGTLYKVPTHNVSHPVAKNVNYVNHFSGRHVPPPAYIDIILENYKLRSSAV